MPRLRFFVLIALLPMVLALGGPGGAAAQERQASLADFAGPWVGRTGPDSDRARNGTVLIERFAGDAFRITWTSFEKDPDEAGGVARRDRSLLFRTSRMPGIWIADPSDDPFDLLGAWARIEGPSLIVEAVALDGEGRLERQTYRRTLERGGLQLLYRRWLDHELDREITARFIPL